MTYFICCLTVFVFQENSPDTDNDNGALTDTLTQLAELCRSRGESTLVFMMGQASYTAIVFAAQTKQ